MSDFERHKNPSTLRDLAAWQWALGLGVIAAGYFLFLIYVGTDFFASTHRVASVTAVQVWGVTALLVLQAAFALLRRRPALTFCLIVLTMFASLCLLPDRNLIAGNPLSFAVFNLTARTRLPTWLPLLATAYIADVALQLVTSAVELHAQLNVFVLLTYAIRALLSYAVPIAPGLLVRAYRRHQRLVADNAVLREREHEAALAATVSSERTRMARELHDIAAYHVSGILLESESALDALDSASADARESLISVRNESLLTWENLRSLVQLLRAGQGSAEVEIDGLTALDDLIAAAHRTHPSARLAVTGDLDRLSPIVTLACFRIVQESLSNARKYAPDAQVDVRVTVDELRLGVEIQNSPPNAPLGTVTVSSGLGLVGMRERAVLLGGHLESGPTKDGGWLTRAVLPIDAAVVA